MNHQQNTIRHRCRKCGGLSVWHLKDGRWKCKTCKTKFRWKSAWEGSWLSDEAKHQILDQFIRGIPPYRMTEPTTVSLPTRERFVRLIRATLAYHEDCREPLTLLVEPPWTFSSHPPLRTRSAVRHLYPIIGVHLAVQAGRIHVGALRHDSDREQWLPKLLAHAPPGTLFFTESSQAYAWFRIRTSYVLYKQMASPAESMPAESDIPRFWNFARSWLSLYRGIQSKYFHLYLGEVAFRFNHRDRNLFPLIAPLLHETPWHEIEAILAQCH